MTGNSIDGKASKLLFEAALDSKIIMLSTGNKKSAMAFALPDEDTPLWRSKEIQGAEAISAFGQLLVPRGYRSLISANFARCRICGQLLESRDGDKSTPTCACGNLMTDGGSFRLSRSVETGGYFELSIIDWVPAYQLDSHREAINDVPDHMRAQLVQERMLPSSPIRSFSVLGTRPSNRTELRLVVDAHTKWEAAKRARESHPAIKIASIQRIKH